MAKNPMNERSNAAKPRPRVDLRHVSDREIDLIKDDLVKAVIKRTKLNENDLHQSHGSAHSSSSS